MLLSRIECWCVYCRKMDIQNSMSLENVGSNDECYLVAKEKVGGERI
jgi:hypothetical protein